MPAIPAKLRKAATILRQVSLRCATAVHQAAAAAGRLLIPEGDIKPTDQFLLRWALLCIVVLLGTAAMLMAGGFTAAGEWQEELLLGRPFYTEAADIQTSLLSPVATFGVCTLLTLYFALVLMRMGSLAARTQVCFLAGVAALLPGMLGTLWHGVLYVAPFLFCLALLWLLTLIPFFRKPEHS